MTNQNENSAASDEMALIDTIDRNESQRPVEVGSGETEPDDMKYAESTYATKGRSDNAVAPDMEDIDPTEGAAAYSAPATIPGERLVPLNQLTEWRHHPAVGSRVRGDNAAALRVSVEDPATIAPIVLLPAKDGLYPIQDGRLRWHAFKEVHGDNSGVEVRCVMYPGTEAEAVQSVADDALGGTPRSAIENARAVLNVQRVAGISQKAISERYSVLKKDQVSRMTIAAKTVERFPVVFNLLAEPDRVTIDICVKFAQFMKTASDEERAAVLEQAEVHASAGASLKRSELFQALGMEGEDAALAPAKTDPLAPIDFTEIVGDDDVIVGAIEMLADEVVRLRLPDPTTMTLDERTAAAKAFIQQIRSYFGLDAAI